MPVPSESTPEPYTPRELEMQEAWIATYARYGWLSTDAILRGQAEAKRFFAEVAAKALREAQQVIAGENSIEWARGAKDSAINVAWAIEGIDDLIARIEEGATE